MRGDAWLADGEELLVVAHPHARVLVVPVLLVPVVTAAATFTWFTVTAGPARDVLRWAVVAAATGVLLRWAARPVLRRLATTYLLTSERLVVRRGLLVRHEHAVPLQRVADAWTRRGLLDRVLGSGTLVVDSAGEGGSLVLDRVPRVVALQRVLHAHRAAACMLGGSTVDGPERGGGRR